MGKGTLGWAGAHRSDVLVYDAMRWVGLVSLCCLLLAGPAGAQDEPVALGELVRSGDEWLRDNVDPRLLGTLGEPDPAQVEQWLRVLQDEFQGEYVVELAPIRHGARTLLPFLERRETTRPYAVWLRARLDYFDVAEELRLTLLPPPSVPALPETLRHPTAAAERQAWRKALIGRPAPPGAATYVPLLKPVFAAERVPPELVWLAEVESTFDPRARSPVGAAGLFQLMPATALSLGLSLEPADERFQPEKAARAAAQYLKYLVGQFGDWRLALAAYNAGEGRVRRLLQKHDTRSFERIAAELPAETQLYVPKIEAVLLAREGVRLAGADLVRAEP